jgi:general secretion pathway protein K
MSAPAIRGTRPPRDEGVAMLLVLWVILVLSLMIGGFAFTMHVETQVASFSRKQLKAEMLARSGLELARMEFILDQRSATKGGFDAPNQAWATNDMFVAHPLGEGTVDVRVSDEESKLPINRATPEQLKRLLDAVGLETFDADVIVDSIIDWIDGDDLHRLNGAESDYYLSLSPPYRAKNAPLDRVEELLLIRGVSPEIFYGTPQTDKEDARPGVGEFFTTLSSGQVNVNTASATVLEAWLGLSEAQVQAAITRRDGADGILGTEDDQPFRTADEFSSMLGALTPAESQQLGQLVTVNSQYFTVKSTGQVGGVQRTIIALMLREGGDVKVVTWREVRGGS